jgi:hypothetical protein
MLKDAGHFKGMPFSVLLLGAGQLGSRYLQGIVRSKASLDITVVDPSVSSLETARSRWIEARSDRCQHEVRWLESVPSEQKCTDLALVATSAKGRAALVARIAAQIEVRYWVIEKVLAQSVEELELITRATSDSHGTWVNTPRRMMVWHQALKNAFALRVPIKSTYSGGLWGLACNSIHFLDLISWWTDEKLESINTKGLDSVWTESKRVGYSEVTGKLMAQYSRGTTLTLEARDSAETQSMKVSLADGTVWKVDEGRGIALSSGGEKIDGCLELQSQLTTRLVDDILLRGHCDLPTLEVSAAIHSVFLSAMLKHWNLSQKNNDIRVPIT